jgi:hypothetical protein
MRNGRCRWAEPPSTQRNRGKERINPMKISWTVRKNAPIRRKQILK